MRLLRRAAWLATITTLLGATAALVAVIVRTERPHPGAQLRFTDLDGRRFTAFAADARKGQLADLELRHRRRVRCEDRIRCAKDTGLRNLRSRCSPRRLPPAWCRLIGTQRSRLTQRAEARGR